MTDNYYERCIRTDMDLCLPVASGDQIKNIFGFVGVTVEDNLGEGPRPELILDLEHLQVVDYGAFDKMTDRQRAYIRQLHSNEPIRAEEMLYLALRSMFGLNWKTLESEDDIRRAAAYEEVLNQVLTNTALDLTAKFNASDALLPYWGRLSFLRVMSALPADHVAQYHLDQIASVLIKRPKFNATTFALDHGPLIGFNFVLEPILKNLNRYLLHFFYSRQMAGVTRLSRAWAGITPTILYFWTDASARLAGSSGILFGSSAHKQAHALTVDQVDFILMHEIGHVALDHPRRLQLLRAVNDDVTAMRHEFEFGADAFAFGLLRSKLHNKLRYYLSQDRTPPQGEEEPASGLDALHEYQTAYGAVCLLFTYMDFIDRAGQLLKTRLGNRLQFRKQLDSHPKAGARLERLDLMNLGELPYTSVVLRYAKEFFDSVFEHANRLDDQALFESLHEQS